MKNHLLYGAGAVLAAGLVAVVAAGAWAGHPPGRTQARKSASLLIPAAPPSTVGSAAAPAPNDPTGLAARLLPADALPSLVAGTAAWQETATAVGPGEPSDLPCQRLPLDALGATTEAYRTYRQAMNPEGRLHFYYAAELIARFPTPDRAEQAVSQLGSWIARCSVDGSLPSTTVVPRGPWQWSVTATAPGPDANPRLGAGARTVGEFAVLRQGGAVAVLYVGAETDGTTPLTPFQDAAAKAGALLAG
ncbi:hypothetical protein [Kitasatospora sp. NPDC093102]|uniref:hypothetical protein n=1 Tax=Kitasatospora sp. NPDC093102 TaxID=3155069 RepID=UPI0034314F9F